MDSIALIWVLVGVALIVTELLATGFIAVFFGVAAMITGIAIALGLPATGPWPWLLFSALSVGLLVVLRRQFSNWFRGRMVGGDSQPGVDEDFIGRDAKVLSGFGPEDHNRGQVDYRGAAWSARASVPLGVGDLVVITARDNLTLIVAPQEN
jgi:membrane protein implicated in regulation of membrane protease activity